MRPSPALRTDDGNAWAGLAARMMRHEADLAFRRRVATIFEWVEPRAGRRVLDVPCGRGFYLNMFRHAGEARLVGAELDPGILAIAQRNLAALPDIALHRADVCALPYADGSFDAVVLSEVLEHVVDDLAALREAYRVLAPGGVVAVTVPHAKYPFLWDPINWILESVAGTHVRRGLLAGIWANHVRLYERDRLREVVRRAGFEIEAERSFTHWCLPFHHNLVYGLGKPLLEGGWLPGGIASAMDRLTFEAPDPPWWHPVTFVLKVLEFCDRGNRPDEPASRSTVNLAIKGRKPVR